MTLTVYSGCPAILQGLFPLWAFAVSLAFVFALIRLFRQKRPIRGMILPFVLFLVSAVSCWLLSRSLYDVPEEFPGNCPVVCLTAALLLLSGASAAFLIGADRWQNSRLTAQSVRECFDAIPTGVCFYRDDGLPLLINPAMDLLCQKLLGHPLQDGRSFWSAVRSGSILPSCTAVQKGEIPMIRTFEGNVYSITHYEHSTERGVLHELIAAEITDEYENAVQLRSKNRELQSLNERLRLYGETVTAVTREQEILAANVSIHDRMNRILLTTRHCIEDGVGEEERRKLFDLWRGNVLLIRGDSPGAESERPVGDPLTDLREAASSIGLSLRFEGSFPADGKRLHLVMLAAGECLTNAARHAHASELCIRCGENSVSFTNDGQPPVGEIRYGGGLSAIRRETEALGGEMIVEISPAYRLTLSFPNPMKGGNAR